MAVRRRRNDLQISSTERFLVSVRSSLAGLSRLFESEPSSEQIADATSQIRHIRINCERMSNALTDFPDILQAVRDIEHYLNTVSPLQQNVSQPVVAQVRDGSRGRPLSDFDSNQLRHLLMSGFNVTTIAREGLLGHPVSRQTIHNFMARNGIVNPRTEHKIDENALRSIIVEYIHNHPNSGAEEIRAYLRGRDPPIVATRSKVRALVTELDPEGVATRWSQVITRRQYSVPGPNSLWHIDSHHSLVRYGIYVHSCVDGYSRLVTYLKAAPYNTAQVAFQCFLEGVEEYGVPSRIRIDQGVENQVMKRFMVAANGESRGSYIEGKSVHNQRVERHWRDVFRKALFTIYHAMHSLEESRALDINNPIHIFCLQTVFIPRLNQFLEQWRITRNNQPLRTEHFKRPIQLWSTGFSDVDQTSTAVRNIMRGPDLEELTRQVLPEVTLDSRVFKEARINSRLSLNQEIIDGVKNIDVLKRVDDFGIGLYGEVLQYVMARF